jgi:hypothetical protein
MGKYIESHIVCDLMKWLRYQRVISLKIQVGNTNQRNKWANTDPRLYRRWDQVPRRGKHPMLINHTRCEHECGVIRCQSQCVKYGLTIGMKNVRQHISDKI